MSQSLYLFIKGKNKPLSLAEILSYLRRKKIKFRLVEDAKEFSVFHSESEPKIESLGGTLKLGRVMEIYENENSISFQNIIKKLNITSHKKKIIFGVSIYGRKNKFLHKKIAKELKNFLRRQGINSTYMHIPKDRTSLNNVEVIKKNLIEESFELLACFGKKCYVGKTIEVHNPFEFQKRDTGKPIKREIYSISPRLSRIMINLAEVDDGILLDPFCGVGCILQEAALMGFDIRGVDKDRKCVRACRKNIEWLCKEYGISIKNFNEKIIHGDARKLSSYFRKDSIDLIVTEPYLGPPLKRLPCKKTVEKILKELEMLYFNSMKEMKKVLKPEGRIVMVSPAFRLKSGGIKRLKLEKIIKILGMKIVDVLRDCDILHKYPFRDYEERHKVLRCIYVAKK